MKHPNIKAAILDMDGVLWKQNIEIGNLSELFNTMRQNGWNITMATNNASLSVEQYIQKLAKFGVHLSKEQIINSSITAMHYLNHNYPDGGPIFIIGEDGLHKTLSQAGFYHSNNDVIAVVVGMDKNLTFEKLSKATLLIRSGAEFIGTNSDRTFPTPEGLIPGVGAILGALEIASDKKAHVVGKPAPEMYQLALSRMKAIPAETLVIGDRLETDILGGQQIGCLTALVLSGVSSSDEASSWNPSPNWIAKDLSDLLRQLSDQ